MKKLILRRAPPKFEVKHDRYAELIGDISKIPYKLPEAKRWALETVHPPFSTKPLRVMGFPVELLDCPLNNFICGLVYSQHNGVGPGHGATAWLCRNLAHDPYTRKVHRGANVFNRVVKSPKPYYQFFGEFKAKNPKDHQDAFERAIRAVWDAYEDLHDINFYNAD